MDAKLHPFFFKFTLNTLGNIYDIIDDYLPSNSCNKNYINSLIAEIDKYIEASEIIYIKFNLKTKKFKILPKNEAKNWESN